MKPYLTIILLFVHFFTNAQPCTLSGKEISIFFFEGKLQILNPDNFTSYNWYRNGYPLNETGVVYNGYLYNTEYKVKAVQSHCNDSIKWSNAIEVVRNIEITTITALEIIKINNCNNLNSLRLENGNSISFQIHDGKLYFTDPDNLIKGFILKYKEKESVFTFNKNIPLKFDEYKGKILVTLLDYKKDVLKIYEISSP